MYTTTETYCGNEKTNLSRHINHIRKIKQRLFGLKYRKYHKSKVITETHRNLLQKKQTQTLQQSQLVIVRNVSRKFIYLFIFNLFIVDKFYFN